MNTTMLKKYVDSGFNIMLAGKHGIGKTHMAKQACEELGLKMKYFSGETIDVYIDIIGIPDITTESDGSKHMQLIQPEDVREAEVIFIDEFNRSADRTQNAILEMVQFRSLNGVALPNLKAIIACINPPDNEEYKVNSIDPAMIDRFHVYIEMEPDYNRKYFTNKFGKDIGENLVRWAKEHGEKATYISPRRLEIIGHVFETTRSKDDLVYAMPPGSNMDVAKLYTMLTGGRKATPDVMVDVQTIRNHGTYAANKMLDEDKDNYAVVAHALKEFPHVGLLSLWAPTIDRFDKEQFDIMTADWDKKFIDEAIHFHTEETSNEESKNILNKKDGFIDYLRKKK